MGGVSLIFASYILVKFYSYSTIGEYLWWLLNYGVFSFEGASFFALGIYLRQNGLEHLLANRIAGLASLVVGFLLMILRLKAGMFAGLMFAVSIPMILHGILVFVPDKSYASLQGLSFPIYLIHLNVVFVYFFLLDKLCAASLLKYLDPGASLLGVFVCFACILFVSIGICKLIRMLSRFRPVIGNVLFGGR